MKDSTNSQHSSNSAAPQDPDLSGWQRLKNNKRVAHLTLPLLIMASIVEVVILATGWKYQQTVCLPQGMGVTFFGIGPIGATILAVELLKLPLAIWTAGRHGWPKVFMLAVGLPLICLLTFQLVKDMAVYEMTTAMLPATEQFEKAAAEEVKIRHLEGELAAIEKKKADRQQKLNELKATQAQAKADLDAALKLNEEHRKDAITLTEYQKKELTDVEARQAAIIKQFDADTAQLTKALTDLRTRRETELARASEWNAEEARIENEFKTKMADYTNRKTQYEKDKAEYDSANFVRRKLMREPVDPGVPPQREVNTFLKPTILAELEAQIKAKEGELADVNNKRRERVAQVAADARRVREEFDRRSTTKRDESDRKREEALASLTETAKEIKAQQEQVDKELAAAVQKVDGIRAEIAASRKTAEGYYEAREAAIRKTQVHRIGTTVEIVRGWFKGERPVSITESAKARGDLLTDQISMVRIWVYPVLAFLVAFLPTLLVELGFSSLYKPEQTRPAYRVGFLGRRLHWLYTRAGRFKILRAERMAKEAAAELAGRERAIASAKAATQKAIAEKEAATRQAQEAIAAAAVAHETQLQNVQAEWVAKVEGLTEQLNQALAEQEALRNGQKAEVERQIQQRQNAWQDRLNQFRRDLAEQQATSESERAALIQEHQKELQEVIDDFKTQLAQARRQTTEIQSSAGETSTRLQDDLKAAIRARDEAESQLKLQADSFALQLSQAKDDGAREMEKAVRQEKYRAERQQMEFEKTLRQREEGFERRLKQREQELAVTFDARIAEEKTKLEQQFSQREAELERQFDARGRERWKQDAQQRDQAAEIRLKQREQELQAEMQARLNDMQAKAEQELRRREADLERELGSTSRDAIARLRQELQQQEQAYLAKLKQREQELTMRAATQVTEVQSQAAADLRKRQEDWERQTQMKLRQREQQLQAEFDARHAELQKKSEQELNTRQQEWERTAEAAARVTESRLANEIRQKEELFQSKLRQRDEQWQEKIATLRAELQAQNEQEIRRREAAAADDRERIVGEVEAQLRKEMQAKQEAFQAQAKVREDELVAQLEAQAQAHQALRKERDDARQAATEATRQVQDFRKKLMDASSFLSNWKNGDGDARSGETSRITRTGEAPASGSRPAGGVPSGDAPPPYKMVG